MDIRNKKIIISVVMLLLFAAPFAAASDLRLIEAIKQMNAPLVHSLLQQHIDVNASEGDGTTALHWAAHQDDLVTVNALIAAGAKVNVTNDLGITPLALACANGNASIVEKLLRSGADVNAASDSGVTPLMEAARIGSGETTRALLASKANVNAKTTDRNQTALMIAAAENHPEVTAALLAHGADVHARTRTREYKALLDKTSYRSAKTPEEVGAAVEMGGTTALLFAAQSGDLESAKLLLKAGAKVNDAGADGNTSLVVATFSGHPLVAALLLDAQADPNAAGGGYTALHTAVLRRDLDTIKALLSHGADSNARLTKGTPIQRYGSQWALSNAWIGATPLFLAAIYLENDAMRLLIAGGSSPTAALPNGMTPLLIAAGMKIEILNRPLDHVDTPTDVGDLCCDRSESGSLEAVTVLLDSGADVNGANRAGDTALHAAAGAGFTSIIQLLADRGAMLNGKNQKGQTALALASGGSGQRGSRSNPASKKAEELLLKLGATP